MSDQTSNSNPYTLAQYVVVKPSKGIKFDNFDGDPALQKLEQHLLKYIAEVMITGEFFKTLEIDSHPNEFYQKLAEKADEFCPGRKTSDLLLKQLIVQNTFEMFMMALKSTAFNKLNTMVSSSPFSGTGIVEILLRKIKSDL